MNDLIIFVHGALSSPSSWAYHRRVLKPTLKNRHVASYSYNVESDPSRSIVDGLVELVLEEANSCNADRVIFVGHSFGGVLAIDAVRELQKLSFDPALKVFTVSSPLGGSGIASFFRIMKPFSTFLKNVGAYDSYMSEFKRSALPCSVHSVVSRVDLSPDFPIQDSDGVVTVESQEHFKDDPLQTISYVDVNHFEVLLDQRVSSELKSFIEAEQSVEMML